MTPRCLAPICAVLALGFVSGTTCGQDGKKMVVEFSTSSEKVAGNVADLAIRPNTGQAFYLFITNNSGNSRDVDISIGDPAMKTIYAQAKLPVKEKEPVRVIFVKPAPPMPPAGAAPPAAPAPVPMPMPMAPPPGVELKSDYNTMKSKLEFTIRVRVTYTVDGNKTVEDNDFAVGSRAPNTYIKANKVTYKKKGKDNQLTFDFLPDKLSGTEPCPVELQFPLQTGLDVARLGEGVYKRNVAADAKSVILYSKNLPTVGESGGNGTVNVTIDGVPRAYVYRPNFFTGTDGAEGKVDEQQTEKIRFMEASKNEVPTTIFSRPGTVPIRVETDLAPATALIQLKIRRLPDKEEVETIVKKAAREERIWFEPAGPEGIILCTSKVNDWVIPLDARDFRGRYELLAELINPANKMKPLSDSMARTLVIDDTKPEIQKIVVLPNRPKDVDPPRHVRTEPLPVHVTAHDPESGIVKVVVFLGKAAPDGKIPETAVEATAPMVEGEPWVAQLPLPMGAKGAQEVTAVAINAVGMSETGSQKIQLLDPPTGGTIKGTVSLSEGGKVLVGVAVKLLDGEGKEKGAAKTDKDGIFEMKDVAPGTYKIAAAKPDSGIGTKGAESVTVKAGEVSKVKIILGRKP